jgi:TolA-binding protein
MMVKMSKATTMDQPPALWQSNITWMIGVAGSVAAWKVWPKLAALIENILINRAGQIAHLEDRLVHAQAQFEAQLQSERQKIESLFREQIETLRSQIALMQKTIESQQSEITTQKMEIAELRKHQL